MSLLPRTTLHSDSEHVPLYLPWIHSDRYELSIKLIVVNNETGVAQQRVEVQVRGMHTEILCTFFIDTW